MNKKLTIICTILVLVAIIAAIYFYIIANYELNEANTYIDGNWIINENFHVNNIKNKEIVFYNLKGDTSSLTVGDWRIYQKPLAVSELRVTGNEGEYYNGLRHFISCNNFIKLQYACLLAQENKDSLSLAILNILENYHEYATNYKKDINACKKYIQGVKGNSERVDDNAYQYRSNLRYLHDKL